MISAGGVMATKYMTLEEAAAYAHMGERTIREKIRLGALKAYKPGRRLLIDPKDLDQFIKKAAKALAS